MEDKEIISRVREALEPFGKHWDEWLNSDFCFLNSTEIKVVGYLLAYQSIERSAHLLAVSQGGYLHILDHTLEKLKDQHFRYLVWVNSKIGLSN